MTLLRRRVRGLLVLGMLGLSGALGVAGAWAQTSAAGAASATAATVAAASDLKFAIEEVAQRFERDVQPHLAAQLEAVGDGLGE